MSGPQNTEAASGAAVAVIGAGIIGLCSALYLRRAGQSVMLVDQLPPGSGASFGNAGLLSADGNVPVSMPGMLKDVPKWLSDPLGPLSVRPAYLPKATPWLAKWIRAGKMDRVYKASDALRAMHKDTFDRYRELLGADRFRDLIRQSGSVNIWDGAQESRTEIIGRELRDRHGIETQTLTSDDLRQMFPGIAAEGQRALLFPRNGYTVNPQRLTATLAELFQREGGTIVQQRVLKIVPEGMGGYTLLTNTANLRVRKIVVAAGAWSLSLLEPLGIRLPLETERGYHYHVMQPSLDLRLPILHRSRGFGLTPMDDGLRLAGTVEIAGLDAPPNERRAMILMQHAMKLFPGLKGSDQRIWMGFRPSLPDSVPAVGEVAGHPGLYLAVGHGHMGMIAGSTTGRLVSELVTGQPPHIDPQHFRVDRFGFL